MIKMLADGSRVLYKELVGDGSLPGDLAGKLVIIWFDAMVNNNE